MSSPTYFPHKLPTYGYDPSRIGTGSGNYDIDAELYYGGDRAYLWEYGWLGPKANSNTDKGRRTNQALKNRLVIDNLVKECTDRHRRGLIGNSPRITTVGSQATAEKLTQWLHTRQHYWGVEDSIGVLSQLPVLPKLITRALLLGVSYARLVSDGEGHINFYCPKNSHVSLVRELGEVKQIKTLIEKGRKDYQGTGISQESQVEIQMRIDEQVLVAVVAESNIESYLDPDTNLYDPAVLQGAENGVTVLNDFSVFELRLDALFTTSVKTLQDTVNYLLSLIPSNQRATGFDELIFTNALPPGRLVESADPTQPDQFVPDPDGLQRGEAITSFISGQRIFDETGNVKGLTQPGVHMRPPFDSSYIRADVAAVVARFYTAIGQGHIISEGEDSQSTGVSRQQRRQDFVSRLQEDAAPIEQLLSRLLTVVLELMGESYDGEIVTNLLLNAAEPSDEYRTGVRENYMAGLVSLETAVADLEYTDDPLAELAILEAEGAPLPPGTVPVSASGNERASAT